MPSIQRLSDDMINKIAAGEVVERPAAAVKELVENAIDAGATVIRIVTEGGGLRLIEVSDNGHGMQGEEALLALERHATSKIRSQEDLEHIATLGFRGEALPSIASVSKLSLMTRPMHADEASLVVVTNGKPDQQPAAAPVGTTIRVQDLFYNTPARLKFMRSERTETMQITEMVQHLAISAPHIAFELQNDDKRVLHTPGNGKLFDVLLALYGRQASHSWRAVESELGDMRLWGYVADAQFTRGTRGHQHWIVNGRYVRTRTLQHALEEAYRTVIPATRKPVSALFLTIPLHLVDVNVHPAKTEIRIHNEGQIHQWVWHTVRQALAEGHAQPEGRPAETTAPSAYPRADRIEGTQLGLAGLYHTEPPVSSVAGWDDRKPIQDPYRLETAQHWSVREQSGVQQDAVPYAAAEFSASHVPFTEAKASYGIDTDARPSIFPPFRVITQLSGTYILAQCARGWLIADQHAADERIQYQKLIDMFRQGAVHSQMLLQPQTLELTPLEEQLVQTHAAELEKTGFIIEPFGDRTVLLRGCPIVMGENSGSEALTELLETLQEEGKKIDPLMLVEKALITISCKSAVKANTWLPVARMEELLQQLGRTEFAATCPHGRPTYWMLTLEELEHHFLRR